MGKKPPTAAAIAAAAGLIAACAAEKPAKDLATAAASEKAAAGDHGARKPGAAVDVTAVQRAAVDPGETGVLEVTFAESYADGTMTVTATGSEGLEILPPEPATTMAMRDKSAHRWDVSFRAGAAGVYYVDFTITASERGGAPEMRSHSERVTVGDGTAAGKPATQATTIDGEPVVIMEAEETVVD